MNSVVDNEISRTNASVHWTNTRNKHHRHRADANLSRLQKRAFCIAIRIFNSLPRSLSSRNNEKAQFKVVLRRYLNTYIFYPVSEFLCVKMVCNTVYKIFTVFCTVIILYTLHTLYIGMFMTFPHPAVVLTNFYIHWYIRGATQKFPKFECRSLTT
jgi:hypothetical protein